jgi:DNA-binding PadR family transcriptional regulator
MSIRAGILAVLTEAPAYGLQIHSELEERTDRRGSINVGQIYSTLDRLSAAGLVRASGTTDDGLPLYGLTDDGRRAAEHWLAEARVETSSPWVDMIFKVLLASSLRAAGTAELVDRYRASWHSVLSEADATGPAGLARRRLAEAAVDWLDDLEALPGGVGSLVVPLRNERPRRGRRPSPAPE